jgi:hypothetical protein
MVRKVCWFCQRGEVWLRGLLGELLDMVIKRVFVWIVVVFVVGWWWVVRR